LLKSTNNVLESHITKYDILLKPDQHAGSLNCSANNGLTIIKWLFTFQKIVTIIYASQF